MKIEIWSDFICPFCYLGKRKMEMALDQFPHQDNVSVVFKSYELDPNSKKTLSLDMHSLVAKKYDMDKEKAKENNAKLIEQAKEVGLAYYFDTMQHTNTFDAHRLAQYARKKGKGSELAEALFYACFTESKNISDHETLLDIAMSAGLQKEPILNLLESAKYQNFVRDDEEQAEQIGIDKVPFYVFNEEYAVSGVQSIEMFLKILKKLQQEETKSKSTHQPVSPLADTVICNDESCEIKRDE